MFGDGGCWYPNNFGDFKGGLIFKHLPVGDTKDEDGKFRCRLQTPHSCNNCNFLAWLLEHQQSTINSAECRLKYKVNTMFCIIIIFEPYHFVLLLQAEDTGLQFSNSVWSSHGLFSVGRKHKMFWLATITTSQLLFILLFVIWNTVIHHCILLRLRLFLAFESHLWCLTTHNNNPPHFTTYKKQVTFSWRFFSDAFRQKMTLKSVIYFFNLTDM